MFIINRVFDGSPFRPSSLGLFGVSFKHGGGDKVNLFVDISGEYTYLPPALEFPARRTKFYANVGEK